MRRIVFFLAAALFAAPATAQDRACRDVRALLNADGNGFRSVAWTMDPRDGVRPTVAGRRIGFPAAPDCELDVEAGRSIGFSCRWESEVPTEAGAVYDRLLGQINPCLPRPLRAGSPFAGAEARIVQRHDGSFVARARQTDVDLTLFEHMATGAEAPGGDRPTLYVVELMVELDTDSEVTPEDSEDANDG